MYFLSYKAFTFFFFIKQLELRSTPNLISFLFLYEKSAFSVVKKRNAFYNQFYSNEFSGKEISN